MVVIIACRTGGTYHHEPCGLSTDGAESAKLPQPHDVGAAAGVLGGSLWPAGGAAAVAPANSEAGTASAAASKTAAPPWTVRLSCSSINFSSLPIEKACRRIAALGFEAIDIWSAHAGCPHLDNVAQRLGPAGLKDLLARHRLKLYAFSVYTGGYRRYAELLGQAGGGVAVRGSAGPCKPGELTARMKSFLETLKPEIELAEKHNSYLAIENHDGALLHTLDSLKAFCQLNTHPRVGIALAPTICSRSRPRSKRPIAIAGRKLFFFYAWQNAPASNNCRASARPTAGPGWPRWPRPITAGTSLLSCTMSPARRDVGRLGPFA